MISTLLIIGSNTSSRETLQSFFEAREYLVDAVQDFKFLPGSLRLEDCDLAIIFGKSWSEIKRYREHSVAFQKLPLLILGISEYHQAEIASEAAQIDNLSVNCLAETTKLADIYEAVLNCSEQRRRQKSKAKASSEHLPEIEIDFDSFKGTFVKTAFDDILSTLQQARATGILEVCCHSKKKQIIFQDGQFLTAKSNQVSECLGRMLVTEGKITLQHSDEALKKAKENKSFQGIELVKLGRITSKELSRALDRQRFSKIYDVFSWDEGTYAMRRGSLHFFDESNLAADVSRILFQGVRVFASDSRITEILSEHSAEYLHFSEPLIAEYVGNEISDADTEFLRLFQGSFRVQDYSGRTAEFNRLLAAALSAGLVLTNSEPFYQTKPTAIEEADLLQRFVSGRERRQSKNLFEVLGVSQTCTDDEAYLAFLGYANAFLPEKASKLTAFKDLSDELTDAYRVVSEAYKSLRTSKDRDAYLRFGEGFTEAETTDSETNVEVYMSAKALASTGEYSQAYKKLQSIEIFYRDDVDFGILYVQCLHLADQKDSVLQAKARTYLRNLIDRFPMNKDVYYQGGKLLLADKNFELAHKYFSRAVQIDKKFHKALRELRLLEMRKSSGSIWKKKIF